MADSDGSEIQEGRRERRHRELRARIYQTAQQLFLDKGFEATTVSQIAEAADIAPATFFNHFRSKSAILQSMTVEVSEHLEAMVEEQLARKASAQERIEAFADRVASDILQVRMLAHDVLLELVQQGVYHGDAAPHLSGVREPFAHILREGQAKGDVRMDYDARFLSELVIGALNSIITNWLSDPSYPLAERLRDTAAFMGEAIRPAAQGE